MVISIFRITFVIMGQLIKPVNQLIFGIIKHNAELMNKSIIKCNAVQQLFVQIFILPYLNVPWKSGFKIQQDLGGIE